MLHLTKEKQAQLLHTSMVMILLQAIVIGCVILEIFEDNDDVFNLKSGRHDFKLLIAKFLTTYAIHFNLLPHMKQSLDTYKYVINHWADFDQPWIISMVACYMVY